MGLTFDSTGINLLDTELEKLKKNCDFTIAFAGNPNVGKSTIFNSLTGLHQHTGNWPGKTVTNASGIYINNDKSNYKYSFAGFTKISGVSLSKSIYEKLTDEEKDRLAQDLAKFLKELHGLKYNKYEEDTINNYKKDYAKLVELIFDMLDDNEKTIINNFYNSIFSNNDLITTKKSLIHNDFSCGNILFDTTTNRISGIIDFGEFSIGYLYTYESELKPVMALKNESSEKINSGDVFYRYRARSEKIKYPEMYRIIEERAKQ